MSNYRKRIGINLCFDPFSGEGYVRIKDSFKAQNSLLQIDCLKDWLYDVEKLYDEGLIKWREEMEELTKKEKWQSRT
mgnify:CR=1 FL=1